MKKIFLYSLLIICIIGSNNTYAQYIRTFAGNGAFSYGGDGGAATAAQLNYPHGITTDITGNVYIADRNNHRVRKVTAGVISTIAGTGTAGYAGDGGPATNATFNHPVDVAVDASGNVYITDGDNNAVRKINSAGVISTIAGTGVAGYNGDGIPATAANLNVPLGICVDGSQNVYVTDGFNQRIRKINAIGVISTIVGNGVMSFSGDGGPATNATLHNANFIQFDGAGNLLISDNGNHRIRKIDAAGIISTIAGNGVGAYIMDGVAATATGIFYPGGMRTDAKGNLYFAENGDTRVRRVDAMTGIISTIAGTATPGFSGDGGPATAAQIKWPTDVAIDTAGNIYIADYNNSRIRVIDSGAAPTIPVDPPVDTNSHTLKIRNTTKEAFKLYPNPNNGNFTVFINTTVDEQINTSIFNIMGTFVKDLIIPSNRPINVSLDLPDGNYLLKLRTSHKEFIEQIMVQ